MRVARRNLYQTKHPINACPFEAVYNGSWSKVDYFKIKEGKIIIHYEEHGFKTEENIPVDNLRLSSRKANLFDCSYFLRPGLDICLLLSVPSETNSPERSLQPVGVDAKIKSIARKPHEHGCTCLFNVCLNGEHPQCEIKELCIDNIAILQQLDTKPCEDGYFRWISSRDCRSRTVTKLFRRQFMHDISWLLVASSLKEVEFEISSVKNKILYRVVSGETDTLSFRDDKIVKAINFKVDSGGLRANTATFVLDIAVETALIEGIEEDGTSKCSLDDPMLRRSERRNIQPERYVGDNFFSKGRSWAANQKAKQYEDHKSSSMFLSEPDSDSSTDSQLSECTSGIESDDCTSGIESEGNAILSEAELFDVKLTSKDSHCSEFTSRDKSIRKDTPNKTELFDVKRTSTHSQYTEGTSRNESGSYAVASKTESFGVRVTSVHSHCSKGTNRNVSIRTGISRKSKVCDVAGTMINGTTQRKRSRNDKVSFEQVQHSDHVSKQINKRLKSSLASSATSTHICEDTVLNQQNHLANRAEKGSTTSSKCVKSGPKHRKDTIGRSGKDVKKRFGMKISGQEFKSKLSVKSREKGPYGIRKTTLLRKNEYSRIIGECMMNIDVGRLKHQQPAVDQWEEIMSNQWWKLPQEPPASDLVENSELEDLWKEMEMSMHSLHFPEENETADDDTLKKSRVDDDETCEHDYILDEQIGTICRLCRSIGTEIRHILPTFIQKSCKIYVQNDEIKFEGRGSDGDLEFNMLDKPAPSRDASILEANASVWALIPDLRSKLHAHQKNAFEFLWKNIAGSLMPADMDAAIGRTGGCIISHSPGAGKTFLIISFLVSYLKLYPGKRPLILAPKTTLHTWYKEFKKWEVSVPLYLIHARQEYRRETRDKKMRGSSGDFTLNKNIMHTVDCLQKFEKWHEHASVLLMSYPSFTTIMKRNSGVEHLNYMARILKKSPGLLILDEGHNPRSTDSVLRKILMRVKTEHRILLSGTLFQNNFEEYFNTLSLARPRFINEVLMKLSPKTKGYQYVKECTRDVQEMRARKFFLETVARSISSKVNEERVKGLNILKTITGEFIDIYESGTSHSLPGLKSCKILMRPSVMQQEYLATLQKNITCQRFFLKLQALVTYASIHPWLIKCSPYSRQCYSVKELKKLGSCKMDVRMGSKVSFVVNLVSRCFIKKEKVLIFCRYKEPIKLFVEIFKKRFGWNKDDQVLVLNGEQELFERSRVIDKFEEPRGSSQVLLASIAACSEGISLTAASRVVLLDSEWNPSKSKQAVARAFRPGQEKMVYVYQLLASGTLEEDKYGKNTWKETLSKMILDGSGTEDRSCRQKEDVDDEVLKEIMDEDCGQLIHGITRDDKWSFVGS